MAKDKKSFLMYADQIGCFENLEDDEAGRLAKHLFRYVNDQNPECDKITRIAFEPIKQQLKRDLKIWEDKREARSDAGKKGGIAKASKAKQKLAKPSKSQQDLANLAVNVNVNVNDIYSFDRFWNLYNKKTGRRDCEIKYSKLSQEQKEKIFNTLPGYIQSTPDSKFRKNPKTYLNGQYWEDETIIIPIKQREGATQSGMVY